MQPDLKRWSSGPGLQHEAVKKTARASCGHENHTEKPIPQLSILLAYSATEPGWSS